MLRDWFTRRGGVLKLSRNENNTKALVRGVQVRGGVQQAWLSRLADAHGVTAHTLVGGASSANQYRRLTRATLQLLNQAHTLGLRGRLSFNGSHAPWM